MNIIKMLANLDEKQCERLNGEYPIQLHTEIENGWKLWNAQDIVINVERLGRGFMLSADNGDGKVVDISGKTGINDLFTFIFLT